MKKTGLITLLVFLGFTSHAQIGMWLGGVASMNSTTNTNADGSDGSSTFMGSFGPTVGFMLGERPAVGINLLVNSSNTKTNNPNNREIKMSGWELEPFFRYYAGDGSFKFFGDAKVGFGGGSETTTEDGEAEMKSTYSTFGFNVCPGIQYWFNDSWSIAATVGELGYNSMSMKDTDGNDNGSTGNFGLAVDFSTIDFAFFWHF